MGEVNDFLRKYHRRPGDEQRHRWGEEHLRQGEENMLKLRKSSGFLPLSPAMAGGIVGKNNVAR